MPPRLDTALQIGRRGGEAASLATAFQRTSVRTQGQYFEPLLSDKQAGELLGLHPKTVQRLARQGELPAVRLGRYWRYRASVLNEWIDLNSTGQPLTGERTQ